MATSLASCFPTGHLQGSRLADQPPLPVEARKGEAEPRHEVFGMARMFSMGEWTPQKEARHRHILCTKTKAKSLEQSGCGPYCSGEVWKRLSQGTAHTKALHSGEASPEDLTCSPTMTSTRAPDTG